MDYESDSSTDSLTALTATTVTLGYASHEPTSDDFSQLGGQPTWPSSQPPSADFATCKCCSNIMPLLLQLNADLPERFPSHERRLYIWGCRKKTCRRKNGSVRSLRGVRKVKHASSDIAQAQENKLEEKKQDIGAALFGGAANPFAANAAANNSSNPFSASASQQASHSNPFAATPAPTSLLEPKPQTMEPSSTTTNDLPQSFASKLRVSSTTDQQLEPPPKAWPSPLSLPKPYPTFHIEAETEYLGPSQANDQTHNYDTLLDTTTSEGGSSSKEDKALYESAHDKTFQTFADTLSQNPEQILRYDFDGRPLLYSSTDPVGRLFSAKGGDEAMSNSLDAKVK
ncbi:MAG: hypothetical protein Q9159_001728, partial [Coniocarpon cinnabarinum]